MLINIFTSKDNQEVVAKLTRMMPGNPRENVIARIALTYSLASGRRFSEEEWGSYNSNGKEYKDQILFDTECRDYYIAIVCQAYNITPKSESIAKYIKLHIDHGLEEINRIFEENPDMSFFDFFMNNLGKGVDALESSVTTLDAVANKELNISKSSFAGPINIKVGYNTKTKEEINFCFNDTRKYSNQHIAVAGMSGSGKTQFAKEFMYQLYEKTGGKVNFLFLDFKGMKDDERQKEETFFRSANIRFVDAPNSPFPLNPLTFISNQDSKTQISGINRFVDIIQRYANLGHKQKQFLKDATKEAFENCEAGKHPSLKDVNECLLELVGDKRDSLTEIMQNLCDYELFDSTVESPSDFLNNNYYFSLSGELDSTVRFTSIFLIIYYIFTVFTNMGNAEIKDEYQSMRYVLIIDEAHDLFREKKSLQILETVLRKIRSYGVSVFLLSQGIKEYDQGTFDFSQECKTSFLLPISDLHNIKTINKFLGLTEKESQRTIRNIEQLSKGHAISNMEDFIKGDIFEVCQYWKESNNRR